MAKKGDVTRNRLTSEWEDDVAGRASRAAAHKEWLKANNAKQLEYDRASLVRRYRASPQIWPDGIDSELERWYGDGSGWPDERVARILDEMSVLECPPPEKVEALPVDTLPIVKNAAYWRERKRIQRARAKPKGEGS